MSAIQPAGYFVPSATGSGKAVLVLHAWWGLNNTIKIFCNRLAADGFVVFAPDLYNGKVTDQIAEAGILSSSLDEKTDFAEAITFLQAQTGSDDASITVIGFSLGAYYALDLSVKYPEVIRAVVVFYGTGPSDFSASNAAYLGHFAGDDDYEPRPNVDSLEESLKSAGRPVTFYHYDGTGHWFFEPDRVLAYNPEASRLAWERTLAFLNQQA